MSGEVGKGPGKTSGVDQRRNAMPLVACIVDQWRTQFGAAFVDQQMATAQQARREHAQVLAHQGELAAARWHKVNAHRCTFVAIENGRTVGMSSPFGKDL